ncbi:MAG: zinc ribbon domain-containing protein [Anaerolineae bacterium]|nr:zinc ribbon domain-containing protein [Anaerolineae bacterium]
MPIYTYRCENCGVQFERTQKFTDQPLTRCPECGKKSLHKVYTPVGIVFKGSGFYATDHRSPSGGWPSSNKSSEEKSASSTEKTSETKTNSESSSTGGSTSSTPAKSESSSKE